MPWKDEQLNSENFEEKFETNFVLTGGVIFGSYWETVSFYDNLHNGSIAAFKFKDPQG